VGLVKIRSVTVVLFEKSQKNRQPLSIFLDGCGWNLV